MKTKRVIARLDVKNNALVKGIHLEGLRVLGSPGDFAEKYYNDGVDEIVYMDVVASLYGRNGLLDLVKETAKTIFVPLTVGGGIRSIEDVELLLQSGADKISINTAAVMNPSLISQIAERFGSSTVVVALEVVWLDGDYYVVVDNGREHTGIKAIDWAKQAEDLGAGELCVTSVDKEGTGMGFDYVLLKSIQESASIPVVVHGGAGSSSDYVTAFLEHDYEAVCSASIFHYDAMRDLANKNVEVDGNKSFLLKGQTNVSINAISIKELKAVLKTHGVNVR